MQPGPEGARARKTKPRSRRGAGFNYMEGTYCYVITHLLAELVCLLGYPLNW